jgi:hypothetical protein
MKSARRIILHLIIWSGVLIFLVFFTRSHHPTLIAAAAATTVLVSACALAVYVNALWLVPGFAKRRSWLAYAVWLIAVVAVLDFTAVISIQLVYDWLGVPREGRYGFWFNMAADGFGIAIHVLAAMFVMRIAGHLQRSQSAQAG